MDNFIYHNPTEMVFGNGQVDSVGKKTAQFGNHVLLVYGQGSIKKTGLYNRLLNLIHEEGLNVFELGGVEQNPRITTVRRGIELCRQNKIDVILAVGGGSAIDAAKAIAIGAVYEGDVWDFYTQKSQPSSALPLGVVVTLAATGSEMNGRSVITNWEEGKKYSINQDVSYPKFAIMDPSLTFTVVDTQLMYGIVDIISHVYEQYISPTLNTPLQDRMCEAIVSTVIENAGIALQCPEDNEARSNLMLCATYALNGVTSVGMVHDWATHRIQYEVAAIYDIPHGGGLAIIMPHWLEYIREAAQEKLAQIAVRVWQVNPNSKSLQEIAQCGIDELKKFLDKIGSPRRLADYGIGSERINEMARKAVLRGAIGGIKRLDEEDVRFILTQCI